MKASPCDTIPFGATEKDANKKLLVFDTGLYLTECGLDVGSLLTANVLDDMNKGDVVEMSTGLELIKYSAPANDVQLFYWYRSGANAETDYVVALGTNAVPVEVKASKKGGMQSLRSFLDSHENSSYGIRVSMESFSYYDHICVFPVYAVVRLSEAPIMYAQAIESQI